MPTPEQLKSISHFLNRGGDDINQTELQRHIIEGWKWNTLLSYNGAVKKFLRFVAEKSKDSFDLPATEDDIYGFCVWAGRTSIGPSKEDILAQTLEKYLYGLRAWHLYHREDFPKVNEATIKLMLTASKKLDVTIPKREGKKAIHLKHLLCLADELIRGGAKEIAIFDTVLCTFWGLARLGEMTGDKHDSTELILRSDIEIVEDGSLEYGLIKIRGAKTASPGEVQTLRFQGLNQILCPVAALRRRLASTSHDKDVVFSYLDNSSRIPLSKQAVVSACQKIWVENGFCGLTGHSFRVGGASLKAALGVSIEDVCKSGRWKSDSWKLYIKPYSEEELKETKKLLEILSMHKLK